MHISNVSVRFGLMLEAYCRGCGAYMKELSNQLVALNKMKQVTDIMQKNVNRKKAEDLLKCIKEASFTSAMEDITSPLDPSVHFRKLK